MNEQQKPFGEQRRERLLAELRRHGAVRVRDLAPMLGVSELTVRRDIVTLAEQRLVTKVHGGATLPVARPVPRTSAVRAEPGRFTVGMVVPSLDFYWPPVVAGARAAAAALGVNLQLRGSTYDATEDRRQIARLVEGGQVQGLLLAPDLAGGDSEALLDWLGRLAVPTVLMERQPARSSPFEAVRSDHRLGVELAVRHLYQHGHRRIGIVLALQSPTSAQLARGWKTACAELGIPDDLIFRESVRSDVPRHRELIGAVLRRCAEVHATALIVHSDPDALSVARYCGEVGMRVPSDLALVSYDDEVAHLAEPALTAVRPPKGHVGRIAVELMVSRLLEGVRRPAQRVLVAPDLVVRGSSVPVP
jgi:DNA-binding LacI/PurR family transcriptional regulator